MKNIYKVIIFSLLLSLLSFNGFAANNTVKISNVTISEINKTVDVKFSSSGFTNGDDLTVLVFKVTDELNTPQDSNIVYVGQPEYIDGMPLISFELPENAEGTYEIRVGGTGVTAYSAGQFTASEVLVGDLDNNGVINKDDAIIILQIFFGEIDIVDESSYYDLVKDCDLVKDGNINVKDAVRLLQLIK